MFANRLSGMALRRALIVAIALSSSLAQAQSQDIIRQQQQQSDDFFRQEQLRKQQEERARDSRRKLDTELEEAFKPLDETTTKHSETCQQVDAIQLDGVTLLSVKEQHAITQAYVGKCLGVAEIDLLLRALTNIYIKKGYVSARPYIPQQDLNSGTLRIFVLEGKVEAIKKRDDKARFSLDTAFVDLKDKPLNIRDIEQGLDQINRLATNDAKMQIQPGSAPGMSVIEVENNESKFYGFTATLDNYGGESSGRERLTLGASLENIALINEQWNASWSRNLESFDEKHKLSQSYSGSLSIPYGYWLFNTSVSESEYESLVGDAAKFISSGKTTTYLVDVSRVAMRSRYQKWTAALKLNHRDTLNYVAGSLIESSSRKATTATLNAVGVLYRGAGTWVIDVGVDRGMKAFGADKPESGANKDEVPTSDFTSFKVNVSYSTSFPLALGRFDLSNSLQAQYSADYLYGADQISIGGQYTVRGYETTSLSGDKGWYLKNDLGWSYSTNNRYVPNLIPYVALDYGQIMKRDSNEGGSLAGMAVGLKSSGGMFSFNMMIGFPLSQSKEVKELLELQQRDVEKQSLHMQLGFKY